MGFASRAKGAIMAQAAPIIALSERLRKQSRKARNPETIADLNPTRKRQLEQEATQLHTLAR